MVRIVFVDGTGQRRRQEFLLSKKQSCVENYFVLTGAPLWTTMRALRGHFGLGGMGTRFVEVEVLLKERLPGAMVAVRRDFFHRGRNTHGAWPKSWS
jgi:hypothetical protein